VRRGGGGGGRCDFSSYYQVVQKEREAVKIIHYGKRRKEASRRSVCGHLGSKTKKTDDPAPPPARRTLHRFEKNIAVKMHLMYYLDENGKRVYTLKVR
jgi:hypothetical protein